ncbi:hypothetical protein [Tropicimonas sp. IMCC6043]|uniref:hypothetical protein n=1 Tax=Tropicimonas sp. IMCC6043 TaxID=2510645 RepID=UPI00101BB7F2|nr:hypothetical protein [Tropicimonas sp. IMCC6043]RYH07614.1 hypothetical protein EU800_19630 [Tropicimonas sp. IMCC6043]
MTRWFVLAASVALFAMQSSPGLSEDLSSNIMRRVNAANLALDKVEDLIRRENADLTEGPFREARQEYEHIFNYYGSSFDHEHPIIVELKQRIDTLSAQAEGASAAAEAPAASTETAASPPRDLSANILRRVDAAKQSLDRVDGMIRTGNADLAAGPLAAAQTEYDNIFTYYDRQFDPAHPTLTALKARIDRLTAEAQKAEEEAEATAAAGSPASGDSDLLPNVRRMIGIIEEDVESVETLIAKGQRTDGAMNRLRNDYTQIAARYSGLYDPNHPDLVALEQRIATLEQSVTAANQTKMAATPVEKMDLITGMSEEAAGQLKEVGVALSMLDRALAQAREAEAAAAGMVPKLTPLADNAQLIAGRMQEVETAFAAFDREFDGLVDPDHAAYVQVKNRIAAARDGVVAYQADVAAEARAVQQERDAKFAAEIAAIMGKYSDQPPTSNLHAANAGKMVFSTQPIPFAEQDQAEILDTFRLTDPIFGRVFLMHSIGNTPIYGSDGRPSANDAFGYTVRLFINGEEKAYKFDVFAEGQLQGEAGESWTTWQFAPNPQPFDEAFKAEADAWRATTRELAPGAHEVRFELWSTQGQFTSRQPVSVGEFALMVGEGDRIAAGSAFPSDAHEGGDTEALRAQMLQAIVGPVTKSADEILKIAVTSNWREGVYSDTKRRYRTVSGAVLWRDTDSDGVCRFTTYNFVSDHLGGNDWSPAAFNSFCLSCPEGDVECP